MKQTFYPLLAFFFSALSAWPLAPIQPETMQTYSRAGRIIAFEVPHKHLTRAPFDDERAATALTNFIQSLDFDRTYFLQRDIEQFERAASNLVSQLRLGDLQLAIEIHDTFMERVQNRIEYVKTLLDEGFDLTRDESYVWRRKDEPWAASEEEWDDLWRKKVKNQYVTRLVSKQLAEERKSREDEKAETEEPGEEQEEAPIVELIERLHELESTETDAPAISPEADPDDGTGRDEDPETESGDEEYIPPTTEESILKEYQQFLSVLEDNDAHWLLPLFLSSFLRAYDPHSDYLSQQNTEDFDISMKLSLVGIGALLTSEDGAAKVVRIIPGGPAERDGRLQPGDKIIAVGQGDEEPEEILHWPLSRSVRRIRGEKNTTVVLIVIPASDPLGTTTRRIDLVRDEVRLDERAAKGRTLEVPAPNGKQLSLGVIQIPDFYADINARRDKDARSVTRDVTDEINRLMKEGIDGLILDLRNNGGGSLPEAVSLTGLFIERGPVVQVKTDEGVFVLPDTEPGTLYDGPLLLLVNRQSASATEIFAGALQDYGRALVVGDSKTHGKGTVQSLFPLRVYNPRLGSLKLTTASYYRIAGGSTQKKGIIPDIIIPSLLDTMEIGEDHLNGALPWTVVDPALYRSDKTIQAWIDPLTERSGKRRERNSRFQAYEELLEHLAKQRQSWEISLNVDERLPMARRESEIAEFISDAAALGAGETEPDDEDDDEDQPRLRNDLILEEGRNILVDLIALMRGEDMPPIDWLLDQPVESLDPDSAPTEPEEAPEEP